MKRFLKKLKRAMILTLLASALPATLGAQSMSSTNYKIPFDDLSGGGVRSTSTTYRLEDTISEQATPSGEGLSSANYKACAGFQCLQQEEFLTVTIATDTSPCTATTTGGTFTVALGTLTTSSVTTGSTHICVIATTNNAGSLVAEINDTGAGLKSTSTPGDRIASNSTTLSAGTAGYGVCVTNASSGFTASSPYNGSCDTGSNHAVGALTLLNQTILSATGPVSSAFGDILTKASISTVTTAHVDYADTMTIIVTATY